MSKCKLLENKIDEAISIIYNIKSITVNEQTFLEKYVEYLEQIKEKCKNKELNLEGKQPLSGLLRWLGEYDNIVKNNMNLYNKIYEIEMIFIKS